MPKKLYVLRHAKAEPDGRDDFSRKLSSKGLKQVRKMRRYLERIQPEIDLILCSPAKRCKQTYEGIRKSLPKAETVFSDGLYEAPLQGIASLLRMAKDTAKGVLVIGHNPGLLLLCALLIHPECGRSGKMRKLLESLPPAALVEMKLNTGSWSGLDANTAELKKFIRPGDL